MLQRIDPIQMDQLREVVNIGVSHASTQLANLLGRPVAISTPRISLCGVEQDQVFTQRRDSLCAATLFVITGDMPGFALLLLSEEAALLSVKILCHDTQDGLATLPDLERSSLTEMGNVVVGALLSAVSRFLNLSQLHSVPDMVCDMNDAVIHSVIAELMRDQEFYIASGVSFAIREEGSLESPSLVGAGSGDLYLFLDPRGTGAVLEATKKILGGELVDVSLES